METFAAKNRSFSNVWKKQAKKFQTLEKSDSYFPNGWKNRTNQPSPEAMAVKKVPDLVKSSAFRGGLCYKTHHEVMTMWFPEMIYTIDILFVVFVLFFAVRGTKHGLSGELAHVVTLLMLLSGFCFFYPQIMRGAENFWSVLPRSAVRIIVPVVLLLAAVLVFVLTRVLFKQLLKSKLDGAADKISGGLAGMLRGILFGLAVLAGLSLIPSDALYRTLSENSSIGAWVCNTLTPWAQSHVGDLPLLKDRMSERLDDITQ